MASLLTIPVETRLVVYGYLVKYTGIVTIFSQYDSGQEVDRQTVYLMQVNRLIRSEVQGLFYKHQVFNFGSIQGLDNFVKRLGPYYTGIIKKVRFGEQICRQTATNLRRDLTPIFRDWLTGVETVTLHNTEIKNGFVRYSSSSNRPEPDLKVYAMLLASKKLVTGNVFWDDWWGSPELCFIPKGSDRPVAYAEFNTGIEAIGNGRCRIYSEIRIDPNRYVQLSIPDRAEMEQALREQEARDDADAMKKKA